MGSEWRVGLLGELVELKRGYDLPKQVRHPGAIPVVSSSGITGYHSAAMVKGPGVVTGRYGTLGQVFYVEKDFWPLNTTLYVRDFKGNDPRFVSYFLRGLDFLAYSDKAAVPGLNRNDLHQARVHFPAGVVEQREIADILATLDDRIDLNRRMSETLEAIAGALFQSWFIDFDPVRAKADGRDPGVPPAMTDLFSGRMRQSNLGQIPEGWDVQTIGDLADVVGGSTPSTSRSEYWTGGIHCWATPRDLAGLASPVLLDTERHITDAGLAQISSGLLPPGTVLLSSRAPIGYLAIAEIPTAINQGFIGMKPRDSVPSTFLWLWARSARDEILSQANGSTFLEISKSSFRPIPVVRPPSAILAAFGSLANPIYRRTAASVREAQALALTRDTLLPKLISGELRVPHAEHLLETVPG